MAEIRYWHQRFAVTDLAFYNGALLVDAARHALPILEGIVRAGLKVVAAEFQAAVAALRGAPGSRPPRSGLTSWWVCRASAPPIGYHPLPLSAGQA